MEEWNAREKQREDHVRDGMPACRGIEEEHERPKSMGAVMLQVAILRTRSRRATFSG